MFLIFWFFDFLIFWLNYFELFKYVGIDLSGNIGYVVHVTIEGVDLNLLYNYLLYNFSVMFFFCIILT